MKADTDWQQQGMVSFVHMLLLADARREEAHNMIEFCLDLKECRKLKFARHVQSSTVH